MKQYLCFFVLGAILASCGGDTFRHTSGAAWGTTYHITYNSSHDLADSVVAEMRRVELSLSMFDSASAVSRLNRGDIDTLDRRLRAVMDMSMRVCRASGGAFDPTVAPLVDLWGFGRNGRETPVPDSAAVARALADVGLLRCRIDGNRLVRGSDRMQFDFSAIAKGYGVDCVAAMLRRNGCTDYMVEIGGEVSLSGHNPSGRDWRISIDAPVETPSGQALDVLQLTDCAIATSGNYRNYRNLSPDSVVGHTIDPVSGYPLRRAALSATVVAPTCALADALATAVMAMPDTAAAHRMIQSFPSTHAIIALPDTAVSW